MKQFLKTNWGLVGLFLLMLSAFGGMIYGYARKSKECELVVFIKGQISVDARNVNHYSNGFTSITLCNGKTEVYHSGMIIKVVEK
jgi:hypothetical protein